MMYIVVKGLEKVVTISQGAVMVARRDSDLSRAQSRKGSASDAACGVSKKDRT
jgi:hypothetical protein